MAKIPPQKIIDAVKKVLYTGRIGDGKIFVYDVEDVVKIRTRRDRDMTLCRMSERLFLQNNS